MKKLFAVFVLFSGAYALAETQVPHTFLENTPAYASEINENFDSLEQAIDANNANRLLSGPGAPSADAGVNGDFYIDTAADAIYGPKISGSWGDATSLIGPQGAQGETGEQGAAAPILNVIALNGKIQGRYLGNFYFDGRLYITVETEQGYIAHTIMGAPFVDNALNLIGPVSYTGIGCTGDAYLASSVIYNAPGTMFFKLSDLSLWVIPPGERFVSSITRKSYLTTSCTNQTFPLSTHIRVEPNDPAVTGWPLDPGPYRLEPQ